MSCLEASDPERLVSANSVNHFLNTLSLSSLSYISRSSASKLTVDCSSSLSLVTKYGRLIQQAILLSAQLILLTQTTVQLFTNNTSHGFIHEFLCKWQAWVLYTKFHQNPMKKILKTDLIRIFYADIQNPLSNSAARCHHIIHSSFIKIRLNLTQVWHIYGRHELAPATTVNFMEFFTRKETHGTPLVVVAKRQSAATRRQTDEQTNRQTDGQHHHIKPPLCCGGLTRGNDGWAQPVNSAGPLTFRHAQLNKFHKVICNSSLVQWTNPTACMSHDI